MTEAIIRAAGGLAAGLYAAGLTFLQTELPDPGTIGNIGLVGVLALIIGRYTFRQLEDYRADLKTARERIDELEDDLHNLGKAKSEADRRRREVEDYAHRLRLYITAAGIPIDELPAPPASMP